MPSWGMIVEPKKKYKQNVKNPYKITQAVLDLTTAGKGHSDLLLTIGQNAFIACTLSSTIPQCHLDLQLAEGDSISFSTRGEGTIHLTGYILESPVAAAGKGDSAKAVAGKDTKNQSNQKNKDLKKLLEKTISDEDDSSDDDFSAMMSSFDGEEESDDEDMGEEEEGEDGHGDEMGDDDSGSEESDAEDSEDDGSSEEEEEEEVKPPPSKKEKKEKPQAKQQQKQKQEEPKQKPGDKQPQVNGTAKDAKFSTLSGGVKVKDMKEGSGAFAKPGKDVVVYYEGRLQGNNRKFDSCNQGSGFKFALGRGAVIKGWDIGVAGMRVGGKRQIICPPNVAYGQKGAPPTIPPNSTLVFDVELRNVK